MDETEFETYRLKKFGQKAINNEDEIRKRLHEVRQNFYNRLESKKLIKKHGKVPFTEHLCVTNPKKIEVSEGAQSLQVNNDIKREVTFYNTTRENVMKGM